MLTDYYWMEGMPDWLPLSDLPRVRKATGLVQLAMKSKILLTWLAIIASLALGIFFLIKHENVRRAEERLAKLATMSDRLLIVQSELEKCDLFLGKFELYDKGGPDAFDKSKPIRPGKYRNKNPQIKSNTGKVGEGDVPRFRLFAQTMEDGEIRTHVAAETRRSVWQDYDWPGQEKPECSISLDGEVQKVAYTLYRGDNSDARRRTNSHLCGLGIWSGSFSGLVKVLRENKTPRIMMRVGGETAELEYDKTLLLECFEVSEVVIRRRNLMDEKRSLEYSLSGLKKAVALDASATGG